MKTTLFYRRWQAFPSALILSATLTCTGAQAFAVLPDTGAAVAAQGDIRVTGAVQINPTAVEVYFSNGQHATLDFYGKNIFRLFVDPSGGILRDPKADPEAQILVDDPRGVCKGGTGCFGCRGAESDRQRTGCGNLYRMAGSEVRQVVRTDECHRPDARNRGAAGVGSGGFPERKDCDDIEGTA